jgi:hypothetical protein
VEVVMDAPIAIPQRKRIMLPILVVLFLISYGLLTLLVVEQGRTIDSQRGLIREIFSDSAQLNAMKKTLIQKQGEARAHKQAHGQTPSSQAQALSSQSQTNQTEANQGQPTQSQSVQTPSSQVTQQGSAKNRNAGKVRKVVPQKPPTMASDAPDSRRNVVHI